MTALPTVRTWSAGEIFTATNVNTFVSNVLSFLMQPPAVQTRQTVAQSIANGSSPGTALTLTAEDLDSLTTMHSTSTNTSRHIAQYPGWYQQSGGCGFASNATGARGGIGNVNGSPLNGTSTLLPTNPTTGIWIPFRTFFAFYNVSDYFEFMATQTSGAALNTSATNTEQPMVSMKWESS